MASYFLKVTNEHTIHYQVIGNDAHPPLILLHGGPGVGCTDNDLRFVKGLDVRAILIDQRGTGKSTPSGSIKDNTTQDLIDDLIVIMDHLRIDVATILGGSWGSALAILFAMQHPERTCHLILRGLFLATKKSRAVYEDQSTEAYQILRSYAHGKVGGLVWEYYYDMLTLGAVSVQKKFAKYFAEYNLAKITEGKATSLDPVMDIHKVINTNRIKLHYMVNDFFISDNYIWNHLDLLNNLPISIVHGKYDEVCDPRAVEKFASLLPQTKLYWVEAGHSPKEDAIVDGVRGVISTY